MITISAISKAAVGLGILGSLGFVLDVPEEVRDWANQNTVEAVNELKTMHINDLDSVIDKLDDGFREVRIEMATSLHRAIESSKISGRIHDFKIEIIKLRTELRRSKDSLHIKEIERDIDRLEKNIERQKNKMDSIEILTKAQIGNLINNRTEET